LRILELIEETGGGTGAAGLNRRLAFIDQNDGGSIRAALRARHR
jgi:hypothetical protein